MASAIPAPRNNGTLYYIVFTADLQVELCSRERYGRRTSCILIYHKSADFDPCQKCRLRDAAGATMLIIAILYIGAAWLVFFRFKLLPWNWPWRIATALLGCFIFAIFVALLNTLTPSGRVAVVGHVVEVTPNVAGTVTSVPVEPNVFVKAGAILFQIDPAPYDAKVKQLQAAVAEARQKVEQLKSQVDLAVADVKGLTSQLDYAGKRRDDIERLASTSATSQFSLQDAVAKVDLLAAQLQAASAREINARLALGSEIGGENTTVAQLNAQLENAQWELDQTTVRASDDGYVSALVLAVGARRCRCARRCRLLSPMTS